MKRYGPIAALLIAIAAAAVIAGCEDRRPGTGVDGQSAALWSDQAGGDQPSLSVAAEGNALRTIAQISRLLHADMTRQEAKQQLGSDYAAYELSDHLGGEWVAVDVWRYDYAGKPYRFAVPEGEGVISPDLSGLQDGALQAQLFLEWAKDGRLIYAILYYTGSDGNVHNYIPAFGDLPGTSSEDSRLASRHGIKLGQTVRVLRNGAAYDFKSGQAPELAFLTSGEQSYRIKALMAHFAELDLDGMRGWVPLWYLTEQALDIKEIEPQALIVEQAGNAEWYPDAGLAAIALAEGEKVYVYEEYGDYYGAVAPESKRADRTPGLVWIRKALLSDKQADGPFVPLLSAEAAVDPVLLHATVNSMLRLGASTERISSVLGAPHFVETSANIRPTGEPMRTLEMWRYEREEAQLEVTWSETGTLREYAFRTMGDAAGSAARPFIASRPLQAQWRVNSDLPLNFLIGAAGNSLLVAGHDGGFSGMHYDANLYAVDPATGSKLWQVDLGYNLIGYALSEDGGRLAYLYYDSNPAYEGKTIHWLHVIDARSGQPLWDKELRYTNEKDQVWDIRIAIAGQTLAVSAVLGNDKDKRGLIEAWDTGSGNPLWDRTFDRESRLDYRVFAQPQLLAQIGNDAADGEVIGLDPATGGTLWTNKGRLLVAPHMLLREDRRNVARLPNEGWTISADELIRIDAATGKEPLRLPADADLYSYFAINRQYLFQVKSQDGKSLYQSEDVLTSLIDMKSGETMWAVKGKAGAGAIEDGRLYYTLGGRVRMAELETGELLWETGDSLQVGALLVPYKEHLFVSGAQDVIALHKADGTPAWRLSDTMIGGLDFPDWHLEYGMITVLDGQLYLGSSNGYLTKGF